MKYVIVILLLFGIYQLPLYAKKQVKGLDSRVSASVGEFTVDIEGLASPHASIVLTDNTVFYRSTLADNKGYFHMSDVMFSDGTHDLCFTSVDFRRVGESLACIEFVPFESYTLLDEIYLPPTIGAERIKIAQGDEVDIYGYSMPGSDVILEFLSEGKQTVKADNTGFYRYGFKRDVAGSYKIAATARFEKIDSLKPLKPFSLQVLSFPEQLQNTLQDILNNLRKLLLTPGVLFPIIIFILLVIIIYFIYKLKKKDDKKTYEKNPHPRFPFTFVTHSPFYFFFKRAHKDKKEVS